jgi:hypothetical protein
MHFMVKQSLRLELANIANDIMRSEDRGEAVTPESQLGLRVNRLIALDQRGVLEAITQLTGQQRLIIQRFAPDVSSDGDGDDVTVTLDGSQA